MRQPSLEKKSSPWVRSTVSADEWLAVEILESAVHPTTLMYYIIYL